jgi:TP901 family phage tail tape measure protein
LGVIRIDFQGKGGATALKNVIALNKGLAETIKLSQQLGAGRGLDQLSAGTAKAGSGLQSVGNQARKTNTDFTALNTTVLAVSTAITAAFVKIGRDGAQAFLSLESAQKTFGVLADASGDSEEAIARVNAEAERLGSQTPKTATEIQNLAVQLKRAGFDSTEIEQALEGVVNVSVASETELGRVGEVLGTVLGQFQANASEAQKFADILLATANSTNTDINKIGETLKFVGGQANAAGLSIEDTSLLIGILGKTSRNSGQAGRELSEFLERLQISASELANGVDNQATRALKDLGVDALDAAGNLRPMAELLPEIRQSFGQLDSAEQAVLQKNLFGKRGGRAFNAIIQSTDEQIASLTASIENAGGVSAESAEKLNQGLSGALTQFSSAYEGFGVATFSTFAPAAEAAVRSATTLLQTFNSLPAPIQASLTAVGSFVGILAAATAAIAAYNLANTSALATQVKAAAVIVQNAVATSADTAAKTVNIGVTKGLAAAQTLVAIATGKATAAQIASTKALLASAGTMAAFAGAIAAVALVADTFQAVDGDAQKLRATTADLNDELLTLREANGLEGDDLVSEEAINNVTRAEQELNAVQRALDVVRGILPGVATAAEANSNRSQVAFGDLLLTIQEFEGEAISTLENINAGEIIDPAQIEANINAIDQGIAALEAEKPVTEEQIQLRDAQIARLEKLRTSLQGATAATDQNTTATEENAAATLEQLQSANAQQIAELEKNKAEAQALLAESNQTPEESQASALANDKAFLQQRLAQQEAYLAQLREIEASDPSDENRDALVSAETEYYKTRTQLAETSADQSAAAEESRVTALEDSLEKSQRAVDAANVERQRSVLALEQELRAAGVSEAEIKERTAQAGLEAEQAALEGELSIQRQRIAAYEAGTKERADAELALAETQNSLLQNQIDQELAAREAEVRAIEEVIAAESRAANESIASSQARLDSITRVEASIQRQNDLLNQQANLQQAITDLRGSVADREISLYDTALKSTEEIASINEKLNGDSELSAEEIVKLTERREALEKNIAAVGFSRDANSSVILQELIALQAQRFEEERAALEQNQAIERLSLEVEIERQRLAAARAVSEEQIALRRLELQRAELEGAIRIANARGDTQAAADAQSQLNILDEQIAGQQELLALTQESQAAEARSAEIQRGTLAAQQQQAQLALAQQQQSTAQGLADQGADVGGRAADQSANLLNQTTLRADQEARASEELANALQEQINLQAEGDRLLSQTTALADEAERYAAAIGGASPSGGGSVPGIPEFRGGGIIPAGQIARVHKDELIRPASALAVTSQKSSRAIDREMRQLMLSSQPQALGRLRPLPMVQQVNSKQIERGFKEMIQIMKSRDPGSVNFNYTNRESLTEEQYRRLRTRDLMDSSRIFARF